MCLHIAGLAAMLECNRCANCLACPVILQVDWCRKVRCICAGPHNTDARASLKHLLEFAHAYLKQNIPRSSMLLKGQAHLSQLQQCCKTSWSWPVAAVNQVQEQAT
jgi:hypothetical protein